MKTHNVSSKRWSNETLRYFRICDCNPSMEIARIFFRVSQVFKLGDSFSIEYCIHFALRWPYKKKKHQVISRGKKMQEILKLFEICSKGARDVLPAKNTHQHIVTLNGAHVDSQHWSLSIKWFRHSYFKIFLSFCSFFFASFCIILASIKLLLRFSSVI